MDGRNDPGGYDKGEAPRRYRIRCVIKGNPEGVSQALRGTTPPEYELGEVVEHQTTVTFDAKYQRYYHSLSSADRLFADLTVRIVQRACGYFYDKDWVPMPGVPDIVLTDAEVQTSIDNLDHGENEREAVRSNRLRYVLSDLPWDQQRALVENIYALRREFGFEKLGEAERPAVPDGGEYGGDDD
jgi:hypothetical protein